MKRKDKSQLTPKEEELMQLLWDNEPALTSKLVEMYPEPRPHFNTVSTVMIRLEAKGSEDRYLGRFFGLNFDATRRFTLYDNVNNLNDKRTPGTSSTSYPRKKSSPATPTPTEPDNHDYSRKIMIIHDYS